jgi:DNA-binding MarR family transcriptional regulator
LSRQRCVSGSELAAHSGRDKGQLARPIGGLRERGLLEARVDESDRRNLRLHLTAEGQSLHQTLHRQARRHASAAVAGLSQEERRQLVELLHKVRANIEAAP